MLRRERERDNTEIVRYIRERERLERNNISRDRKKERINWSGRWKERSRNRKYRGIREPAQRRFSLSTHTPFS